MPGGYSKAELESAVIQALSPLSVQGGGYLRALRPYRGELLAGDILPEALQLPAVFVSYSSSAYAPGPYLHVNETLTFNIIVICRVGVVQDAYKVQGDIRDRLCGSTLGLDITPLRPIRESALLNTREVLAMSSLYSFTQKVRLPAQGQNT